MEDVNIAFDSFEFDDRLLSKLDAEVFEEKENSQNRSIVLLCSSKKKNFVSKEISLNDTDIIKKQYYNLPLSINDLSTSNSNNKPEIKTEENDSIKVLDNSTDEKITANNLNQMPPNGGISPILRILPSSSGVPLSSTPLLKNRDTSEHRNVKEENQRDHISQHVQENSKKPEFEYLDFDLFEDWDTSNFLQEKVQDEPSFLTLSQAVELIEEAHKAEELNKIKEVKTGSNDSIDLLAGEVIESEKNLFPELLNLSKSESLENKTSLPGKKFTPNCKSVIFGDSKSVIVGFEDSLKKSNSSGKIKSSVAQKLNFDGENITSLYSKKLDQCSENNLDCKTIEFDSDNSVDAILQLSFFENIKADKLSDLPKKQLDKIANVIEKSSVEFIDDSFNCKKKRGKFFRIKESDSEDDQSNSLLVKQKKVKKRNAEEEISGKDFLDVEAEVSDQVEVTSDEVDDEEDVYEKSFVDDECYFTQNMSAEMTANYLESVKDTSNVAGKFKIPQLKPYIVEDVYSQIPVDTNSDYEIDSFCVNDVEYEERELSDLEVAEQVLEIERKSKYRRFKARLKKKKH